MANEEQLSILKQGVKVWNEWRLKNIGREIDLSHVVFKNANLIEANLVGANLSDADLESADLSEADFRGANFRQSNLSDANLSNANLRGANLIQADFWQTHLMGTILIGADLSKADLSSANFSQAYLDNVNLSESIMGLTKFSEIDLSKINGLETVTHEGPSTIGTNTIQRSKGKIPVTFLRGCGLSDADIEYAKLANPELSNEEINKILYEIYDLRASQALQISPLFISYSHTDAEFVDKLEGHLTEKGIRFWRDIHHAKAGRLEKQIDKAIRQNPTVLLILSEHSIKSDWVEHEVRTARGLEKEMGRDVLVPVALDDSWKC